jgi:hypothetical protein
VIGKTHKKRSGKRAISPVISSVIMTGAMVAIVSVALIFANNTLWSRVAEGEFDASKQLMQTAGLQIDDVAWTIGRTETIRYASQYGEVVLESPALSYTISVVTNSGTQEFTNETGILSFELPTSRYTVSNGYWEKLSPSQDTSLTLKGTSTPISRTFVVEKLPMYDGDYIRVVVAPAIRVLNSSISTPSLGSTFYVKMYLPVLAFGEAPRLSQSITLTGESVEAVTLDEVESISVSASFPSEGSGFDSGFFNFPFDSEEIPLPPPGLYDNIVLELYLSEVSVDFGLNY